MSGMEKIEIPSVELLDRRPEVVQAFREVSRRTRVEPGWHYLLDLAWIAENLEGLAGGRMLDAGAGLGLMQWYLIEQGAREVVSADRDSRYDLPLVMRAHYRVSGLRPGDLGRASGVLRGNVARAKGAGKIVYLLRGLAALGMIALPKRFPGKVRIYNQDLAHMPEIPDNSLDAVVAVSALEHNTPEGLRAVVREIMRKLKPGGRLLATLCAAKEGDWFHEPSRGWCYTEATLRRLFDLPGNVPSNYARFDELFEALKGCAQLREGLAEIYFQSGENGMPWGRWDPQYQPVGVCKVKPDLPGSH